jgi:uncharacterized protein YndB with AHSA1/START domain
MSHRFIRAVSIALLGLTLALGASRARAQDIEPTFEDEKTSTDKDGRLHLEAVADLNAPLDKVYDAFVVPEKVAKYNNQVTGVKVLSQSDDGKVVEYEGQTLPIPNAPKTLQVKYTFHPKQKAITAQSSGKALITFRADYFLKPSKDGKGTVVNYNSVSSNPGKLLGMDTPEFMRKEAALNTFMNVLRNIGRYIQNGGK